MKNLKGSLAIVSLLLSMANAMADAGHIRFAKGQVFIGEKPAAKDQTFNSNEIISTKANSLAIITLNDGSTLKLNELTSVAVNNLISDKAPTRVTINSGSLFVNVIKQIVKKEKFVLKTKNVAMGVRGTTFFASFGKKESNDIWMCVNEGEVAVQTSRESSPKLVKAGEGVKVQNGEKTSNPKPLPWTKNLNWNLQSDNADELVNKVKIEEAYSNPLEFNYE